MFIFSNLLNAMAIIIHYALQIYMWLIVARAVISWVSPDPYNPIVNFLYQATEPVLYRVRRLLPFGRVGGNRYYADYRIYYNHLSRQFSGWDPPGNCHKAAITMVDEKILFDDEDSPVQTLKISPTDIIQKEFSVRFRGYDINQVDNFLEELAKELNQVLEENTHLKEAAHALQQELTAYREKEKKLYDALAAAKQIGGDMQENARKRSVADYLRCPARCGQGHCRGTAAVCGPAAGDKRHDAEAGAVRNLPQITS